MSDDAINTFRLRPEADGGVALEFGSRPVAPDGFGPPDPSHGFVTHHHIALTQPAAWRLAHGLALALRRPMAVAAPGQATAPAAPLPVPAARAPQAAPGSSLDLGVPAELRERGSTPLNLPHDPMAEAADWLRSAVREMAAEHFQERSFRLAPGSLQANRFLLSINSRHLPADAFERSWAICQHLGLPKALRVAVQQAFADAAHLHFGFEGEPGQIICKLYVERSISGLESAQAREQSRAVQQYLAFKWNVETGQHVVSRYHWHPGLSAAAIAERMAAQLQGAGPVATAQAQAVLALAAERLPADRLLYLEVTEDGQPRRSFDLNAYDAQITLRELQPVLFALRDHFEVGPSRFQALYDQVKGKRFGHLAGGVHRDGRPFFNVYFGGVRVGG